MNILYFAWLRSQIGTAAETVELPEDVKTLNDLLELLKGRGEPYLSAFADMTAIRVAVDQEYAKDDISLDGVQEIAFFPPVTGG